MKTNSKPNRTLRAILLAVAIALILVAIGLATLRKRPWIVPSSEKARKNPVAFSDVTLRTARSIYDEKCADCHGDGGKGDGSDAMMYDPPPADLTNAAHVSKLTDGEIYYQITEGRKPMPSFKTKLSDDERWQLVLLVRSFANGTAPPPTPEQKPVTPAGH